MKKTYEVTVFNTVTRKFEKVSVRKEVYHAYLRTGWNIKDNDKRFYEHEIQFGALIGGDDGAYENFREFIDTANVPDTFVFNEERKALGYKALDSLTKTMRRRFLMRYEHGYSIKEIAEIERVSVDAIKDSIERAQMNLKNFFRNFEKETP